MGALSLGVVRLSARVWGVEYVLVSVLYGVAAYGALVVVVLVIYGNDVPWLLFNCRQLDWLSGCF